jgi:hypothetical protein
MSKQIRRERGHPARMCAVSMTSDSDRANPGKAQRRTRLGLLLTAFLAAFLAAQFLATSGIAQRPAVAANSARNAALAATTDAVLKQTSELRQLSILRPVHSSALTRAEIERSVIKNLDEDMTPAEMHASEVTLKKLGLAPADFQYRPMIVKLLTEQIAGYYDPKTREFYLADWIDPGGQKPIMAHELTHALQDQHFDLRRFEHWPKGDSDAELAAHSLIEGDATLSMMLYVANNPMEALAFIKSLGTTNISSAELDKAPRALRETLLFPYQSGLDWTRALYKRDGWNGVSEAFTNLPQSTEQILHPEKYFAHEAPIKVVLPEITNLLDAVSAGKAIGPRHPSHAAHHPSTSTGAWRRIDYDVQGEWGFYLILDQFLKSPAESRRAAAGWGGDHFDVYEGAKGGVLFVSLSAWDTENDAREFFDAYVKRTKLRYPEAQGQASETEGQSSDSRSFRTNEGSVVIELQGTHVLIAEGVPDSVDQKALRKSLWR